MAIPAEPRTDVTEALAALTGGDESAAAHLLDFVYEELRALAGSYFRDQPGEHTLQPTALVHEAFLKVTARTGVVYEDRAHFFALCAVAMRHVLTAHARRRGGAKRGGDDWQRVAVEQVEAAPGGEPMDAVALDEALTELAARSERQARIVEYRFFSGMTIDDIARVLDVSRSTVEADWRMARAWLGVQLRSGDPRER
jgi:RNA polymerase sigma factor (TIGR02999 family)